MLKTKATGGRELKKSVHKICRKFLSLNDQITNHKILFSVIFSVIVSSVCLLECGVRDFDNCIISLIVNGYYGADNYCIFMNYYFCKLVKYIDFLFPYANGYLLICHILFYIATFWIANIIVSKSSDIFKRIVLLMTVIIVLLGFRGFDIANQNFTVQAGSLAAVGAICIFAGMNSKKYIPHLIMAIIFFSFGAMIRIEASLLVIPYVFLHIGIELILSKDKTKIKKVAVLTIVPLLFVAGIYGVNTMVNKSETYAPAVEYNTARSSLVDYPLKDWDDVKDVLPELTENDYTSRSEHLYGDTERYDVALLRRIYEVAKIVPECTLSYIVGSFGKAIGVCMQGHILFSVFLMVLSLFAFLGKINAWRKIEVICAFAGTLIISTWFAYNGRIVFRICAPLLIMCYVILSIAVLGATTDGSKRKPFFSSPVLSLISLLVGAALLFVAIVASTPSSALFAKCGADETPFEKSYEATNLYIWSTYTMDWEGYGYFSNQGKLPTKRFIEHNIPQGDYIYGQAFTGEYFDKIGTHNPVRALLERENTFYVAKDPTQMETYLREHVDHRARAKKVDSIKIPAKDKEIPVWRFEVEE